jgi:hypothetical protein
MVLAPSSQLPPNRVGTCGGGGEGGDGRTLKARLFLLCRDRGGKVNPVNCRVEDKVVTFSAENIAGLDIDGWVQVVKFVVSGHREHDNFTPWKTPERVNGTYQIDAPHSLNDQARARPPGTQRTSIANTETAAKAPSHKYHTRDRISVRGGEIITFLLRSRTLTFRRLAGGCIVSRNR